MMRALCSLLAALSQLVLATPAQAPAAPASVPTPAGADASCRVCHPGAVSGLRQSAHQALLQRDTAACAQCHGDLSAHAASPGAPVAAVEVASCNRCHPGRSLAPASAAHPLQVTGSGAPPPPSAVVPATPAAATTMQFSGLVELGYRLLQRSGSRQGYRTDVDLDPGLRLRAFELRGQDGENDVLLRAHDLGDPRFDVDASVRRASEFDVAASYHKDRFRYRSGGDFHRVDRDSETWRTDASVALGGGLVLFANHSRSDDDGFWLTQRIGDRNLPVQTVVSGVASPRHLRSDEAEVGLSGAIADWRWTVAAGWFEQQDGASWRFAQPALANPAFVDSEDFGERATLRGPEARLSLQREVGPLRFAFSGRGIDHDRRVAADGSSTGFEVAPFTTTSTAAGSGHSRTLLLDGDLTLQLSPALHLDADLHWRQHDEHMHLAQDEVTVFPTLPSTVTVTTLADHDTVQRLLDGAVSLGLSPTPDFDVSLGYGFAREQLRVPALQPADPLDFRRGHGRDDGVLAAMRWRPVDDWTLRAELRDFGRDGVPLHELVPERTRLAGGSLDWQHDGRRASAFVRHRRSDNDVSRHHLESLATGLTMGIASEPLAFDLGYTFARTDSRTLSNFYFDPDPAPVPTFVGFHGDTHTVTGSLVATPFRHWRAELSAAFTTTAGSFDVRTVDWRADLQWQASANGTAGIELRQLRYQDDGATGDWRAGMVFVYWRQQW